jgi:membrane-bound lytic murein transglycosylase D
MSLGNPVRRYVLLAACASLILLAGCPKEDAVAGPAPSAQATAPPLNPQAASQAGNTPAASAAATQLSSTPVNARQVQRLIDQVEKSYRSGVDNYRAGRLDAARQDFDFAVDTMLASGFNLKTEPALSDEFEHLLNQINALEMDALKQGNGLSPVLEAAPLDEAANEVTFPANPELTAQLNAELKTTKSDFPLVVNDYVAGYISYFTNSPAGHAHLLRSLERAGKYKDMISKDLSDAGVPQDLIYLAVAESGFQPQVVNAQSGAGGMWQFMPTGAYGLARNGWFDERFDPDKSSKEYAKYIKELYQQFGDWYLAMAAYNWGPGNVQRAVMRTGYADFWELYRRNALPTATKNYVPGIIAAIIMAKNPEKYGLDKMVPEPAVVSDVVPVEYAIDLRLVADVTGASVEEIVALNPSLLRMRTPSDVEYDLHIPFGTKDVYLDRLKSIPEDKRAAWRFHTVKPGESLEGIATSLHARATEIAETNGISLGDTVEPGDELVIPLASAAGGTGRVQHYTMKRSDTLITVADRFNVSPEELRKWNHLSSSAVRPGRVLAVSEPVPLAPSMRAHGRGARARKTAVGGKSSRSRESIGQTRHAPQHAGAASARHSGKQAAKRTTKTTANSSPTKRKAAR